VTDYVIVTLKVKLATRI